MTWTSRWSPSRSGRSSSSRRSPARRPSRSRTASCIARSSGWSKGSCRPPCGASGRKRGEFLEPHGRKGYEQSLQAPQQEHAGELAELERFMTTVLQANEPTVLPATHFEELLVLAGRTYQDLADVPRPYLTDKEVRYLTIPKGSLDEAERLEIESHVNHTYSFLKEIPWTRELHDIPLIADGHHEKLDRPGYPPGVTGDAIPVQTRMMTISDIYDALTAADRPYKPAVPPVRALDIMDEEVRAGQLDGQLLQLFVDAKVFESTT